METHVERGRHSNEMQSEIPSGPGHGPHAAGPDEAHQRSVAGRCKVALEAMSMAVLKLQGLGRRMEQVEIATTMLLSLPTEMENLRYAILNSADLTPRRVRDDVMSLIKRKMATVAIQQSVAMMNQIQVHSRARQERREEVRRQMLWLRQDRPPQVTVPGEYRRPEPSDQNRNRREDHHNNANFAMAIGLRTDLIVDSAASCGHTALHRDMFTEYVACTPPQTIQPFGKDSSTSAGQGNRHSGHADRGRHNADTNEGQARPGWRSQPVLSPGNTGQAGGQRVLQRNKERRRTPYRKQANLEGSSSTRPASTQAEAVKHSNNESCCTNNPQSVRARPAALQAWTHATDHHQGDDEERSDRGQMECRAHNVRKLSARQGEATADPAEGNTNSDRPFKWSARTCRLWRLRVTTITSTWPFTWTR